MRILSQETLQHLLSSEQERVRLWATYQLLNEWRDEPDQFIGPMLDSPLPEVREVAIHLINRSGNDRYAFKLLGLFQRSTGRLRCACAEALVQLRYEAAHPPLLQWLQRLLLADELNLPELQCAARCWLQTGLPEAWDELEEFLQTHQSNHLKALTLFEVLCLEASTPPRLRRLLEQYQYFRKEFTDPQFSQYLLSLFDFRGLLEFIKMQFDAGAGIGTIYEVVMGSIEPLSPRLPHPLVRDLDALGEQPNPEKLLSLLQNAAQHWGAAPGELVQETLKGFADFIQPEWDQTIIRIQEAELLLLTALPLEALRGRILEAVHPPEAHWETLQALSASSLISVGQYAELIQQALASGAPPASLPRPAHPRFSAKELLLLWAWGLPAPQECNYPLLLPHPWELDLPALNESLVAVFCEALGDLIDAERHEEVDYALQLFQQAPSEQVLTTLLKCFTPLLNQHYTLFFDLIERLPDARFIPKLLEHYREGEQGLAQLTFLLCTAHQHPCPDGIDASCLTEAEEQPLSVRITCIACRASYHYDLKVLYYDPEALEQRRPFQDEDLWTPDPLHCKNCATTLVLRTDSGFRTQLYTQLLTARLLKLSEQEEQRLANIRPLRFPVWEQRRHNPESFLAYARRVLEHHFGTAEERGMLLYELGRLYLELRQWDTAQDFLRQSLQFPGHPPATLFHLGAIAFQQKNLYEARLHFSQLVETTSEEDFRFEEENLHQLAQHYLEILDRPDIKRSGFRLIS